jgi:methyl-accepting chemotaxis protein
MKFQTKIIVLVFAGLLAGFLFSISVQLQAYFRQINKVSGDALANNTKHFENIVQNETQKLLLSIEMVMFHPAAQEIFLQRDSEVLYRLMEPIYKTLIEQYGITQIFFIEPEPSNICILRMHNPQKKGDTVNRKTYLQAVHSKKMTSGLEPGTAKFSLRSVSPWYVGNDLIGYLEMSEETDELFDKLKKQSGNDFAVGINRKVLNQSGWNAISTNNNSGNENNGKSQLLIFSTNESMNFWEIMPDQTPLEGTILHKQYEWEGKVFVIGAIPIKDASSEVIGSLYSSNDITTYYIETKNNIIKTFLISLLIIIVFSVFSFYIVNRNISNPLNESIEAIKKIAQKQININLKEGTAGDIGKLNTSINEVSKNFRNIILSIRKVSQSMSNAANRLSSLSENLTEGANKLAATIQEISASMEQMMANFESNLGKTNSTGKVAADAAETMNQSMQIFKQVIDSIQSINSKIGAISKISQKTDILAINASVEAARAGIYGKGFGVIAEEVRKLSLLTNEASGEIKKLSDSGNEVAMQASILLSNIIPEINKSAELVLEIVSVNFEQKTGADHISVAIYQLSEIANKHSRSSEEVSSTAKLLANQAVELTDMIALFDVDESKKLKGEKG